MTLGRTPSTISRFVQWFHVFLSSSFLTDIGLVAFVAECIK
jgi:hypothetical protein